MSLNLLLFSDVHASRSACTRLVELSKDADLVIGAGDFGNMRTELEVTIEILSAIDKPTILVPGNGESDDELLAACQDWSSATVLHGSGTEILGLPIFGIGGGIPTTPFGSWSFDFTEKQAEKMLVDCPQNGLLISHSPPYQAVDSSGGRHLGSTALRRAIELRQLSLVVCGHIHSSAGSEAMIGSTRVINAGWNGWMVEV
jgi:Icc-related predicted phosphoesterase